MRNGGDAGEPVLPLSSSGVMRATASAAASTEQDTPPPLPPPGATSLNTTLNSDVPRQASGRLPSRDQKKVGKASSGSKSRDKSRTFEDAVGARGVQKKSTKEREKSQKASLGDLKDVDLEVGSHTSGLSRPSSRASQASEFSGLGQDDDFMAKYKMMKLMLKEKEKELQKANEEAARREEPFEKKSTFPQMFGRNRSEQTPAEEEVLLQPPDPAVILTQVRRRRFVVLILIFAGMCALPVMLVQSFRREITP